MSNPIEEYIKRFPEDVQKILKRIHELMRKEIPGAEEVISYGIPTFKINGKYVAYFAGFKKHVSIYPATEELPKELQQLEQYRTGKGTYQFALDQDIPFELIRQFARFRMVQRELSEK